MLKISGLWESSTHRGLVYKFIVVNSNTNQTKPITSTSLNSTEQNKIV
jgi:hypothetical protein